MFYFFFFFPIGTDVRLRRRPWVTVALFSACVLAYLATGFLPDGPRLLYQLAWKPRSPSLLTAVTSCFMHAGLLHLIGNMLYLAFLGPPVEDRLGRRRFLLLYLLTGACAMVAQAFVIQWRAPDLAGSPVVGASGAVAGVLGAFIDPAAFRPDPGHHRHPVPPPRDQQGGREARSGGARRRRSGSSSSSPMPSPGPTCGPPTGPI